METALLLSLPPCEKADRDFLLSDTFLRASSCVLAIFPRRLANRGVIISRKGDVLPIQAARVHLAEELRAGIQRFSLFLFRDFLGGNCHVALEFRILFHDGPGGPPSVSGSFANVR